MIEVTEISSESEILVMLMLRMVVSHVDRWSGEVKVLQPFRRWLIDLGGPRSP